MTNSTPLRFSLTLVAIALLSACGGGTTDDAVAERTPAPAPPVAASDTTPPVIELLGQTPYTLPLGQTFEDPGAKAVDDRDGEVSIEVNTPSLSSIGTFSVVYSAKDTAGNESSAERTVIVADVVAPVVTLNGDSNITIGFGEAYTEQGATANDNVDGNVDVSIDGTVGQGVGDYTITYSATDAAGNSSSVQRVVMVEDLTAPMITLNGPANINLEFGSPYNEQGASATDDVDDTVDVSIEGTVGEDVGIYTIVYLASDSAGNEATLERRIKVERFLFEEDIARDIRQSTPTDVNIPKGLAAVFDIEYLGAFRVLADGESRSDYAVGAMGFNKNNNSIYLAGHAHHNAIAEFAIPDELSLESDAPNVVQAEVLQQYIKILDKREIGNQTNKINGMLHFNENLLISSEIWYDGGGSNTDNLHVFSNPDVLSASPFKGMLQLEGAARAAGYMSKVPAELIDVLGAEYITGWASNYSITSRYSQGPSVFLFNPQEAIDAVISVDRTISSSPLMVFPLADGKELAAGGTQYKLDISPLWGAVSKAKYGFIVLGTSIFMAIGQHGGLHSGIGYKITQDTGRVCPGQCTYEANDNYNYFWLFDINDMLAAEQPWEVRPISYGKWSHPFDKAGEHNLIGATFDDSTQTLYIALEHAGQTGSFDQPPMIIAYKIDASE
jgi:hypothetical protein